MLVRATPAWHGRLPGRPSFGCTVSNCGPTSSRRRGRQYVWHVQYVAEATNPRLPVVADEVVYLPNWQTVAQPDTHLVAASLSPGTDRTVTPRRLLWSARRGLVMRRLIQVGRVLCTRSEDAVYATRATDGAELGRVATPGAVTNLAFHAGRLVAVCATGDLVCYAAAAREGAERGPGPDGE